MNLMDWIVVTLCFSHVGLIFGTWNLHRANAKRIDALERDALECAVRRETLSIMGKPYRESPESTAWANRVLGEVGEGKAKEKR